MWFAAIHFELIYIEEVDTSFSFMGFMFCLLNED